MKLRKLVMSRAGLTFLHDTMMSGAAFALAMYLRLGSQVFGEYLGALMTGLPVFMGISAVSCFSVRLYRGMWRYASLPDLVAIAKASALTMLLFVPVMFFANRMESIPRATPIIALLVQLAFLGGPRFAYRWLKDKGLAVLVGHSGHDKLPVLLVGAGNGASLFIRALRADVHAPYRVVGALDDALGAHIGQDIHGVPILGHLNELVKVVARLEAQGEKPQKIVVSGTATDNDPVQMRFLVEQAEVLGLSLARLPRMTDLKEAQADPSALELKPVAVEDLLGRPQAALDRVAIAALISGKRVMVTGAGGTIGGELVRQVASFGPSRLVLVEKSEYALYLADLEMRESFPQLSIRPCLVDITNRLRISQLCAEEKPDIVFHAAALKHVPMVEMNPCEGLYTNGVGTRNVADAAKACGAMAMVMISTDKAVTPANVMGASKRLAEMYCQALDIASGKEGGTRFMTVRFGNVLGSTGSVVPLFERQLARGGPLTVTHPEVRRFFMTCREAVQLVLQASTDGAKSRAGFGEIFVLDMGQPVRISDLARQMIRLAGLRPDVDVMIEYTGLRPGEKLDETLFHEGETMKPSRHDGIMIAEPRHVALKKMQEILSRMEKATLAGDVEKSMEVLMEAVPEYKHA
ncbi:MAG TPA: nucleotide sugar dehydratase [Rhodospirillaceae bacterium]|nr:MAG: nucleotide sugar dehydratase [Alphaproteobacteria bacterium GWF2_58_20]HAU29287.1 nucleotide sugar dehydratase [Rhodospirillaceae bacterium]